MSLLLSGVALTLSLAAAPVEVAPAADLSGALGLQADPEARYGLNGAPPGGRGELPSAPASAGQHFLVVYAPDGTPSRWLRFVVPGGDAEPATLTLGQDRQPPSLSIRSTGTLQRDGILLAGADARLAIEAADPSGLADDLRLIVDGQQVADPARIPWPESDRTVRIEARGSDALGNAGSSAPLSLVLDRTPPGLQASRASDEPGVPADVVAAGETIRLALDDAGSGLASLTLGGSRLDLDGGSRQDVALPMPADTGYTLADRLGNVRRASLPLRLDDAPPELLLISDGQTQRASEGTRLPRSERLELVADDPLAGVERACVELSIWYGDCRPLPLSLVGIDPGRYRLVFRASDRLGHKAYQRLEIEVLP